MSHEPRYKVGDLIHVAGGNAFRVEKVLGSGGMGAVYLGTDKALDELRVMKMLHPEHARDRPDLVERFLREARAITKIKHQNIVRVYAIYAVLDEYNTPAFTMEALEGIELAGAIEDGIAPGIALDIIYQVLAGLDAMHQRGVVHRDVKPGNILLYREHKEEEHWLVKVLDLSVVRVMSDETRFEGFIGTFGYASDRQLTGKLAEPQDDVWSAFLVLLEVLTGTYPFVEHGQGREGAIARVGKRPRLLRDHGLDYPDIDELLEMALHVDPKKRFLDAYSALKAVKKLFKKYAANSDQPVRKAGSTTQDRRRPQEQITEAHLSPTSPDVLPAWLEEFRKHQVAAPVAIRATDSVVDEKGPTTPGPRRAVHKTVDERLEVRGGSTMPSPGSAGPPPASAPLSPPDIHRQPTDLPSSRTPPMPELALQGGAVEYVESSRPPAQPDLATKKPRKPGPKILMFVVANENVSYASFIVDEFPVVLGREAPADIVLEHRSVSLKHACIDIFDGAHVLIDLGSTNGTHVDTDSNKRKRLEPRVPIRMLSGTYFHLGALGIRAFLDEERFSTLIRNFNEIVAEKAAREDVKKKVTRTRSPIPVGLAFAVGGGTIVLVVAVAWLVLSR